MVVALRVIARHGFCSENQRLGNVYAGTPFRRCLPEQGSGVPPQFGNTVRRGCIVERLSANACHWVLQAASKSVRPSKDAFVAVLSTLSNKSAPRRLWEAWKVVGFFIRKFVLKVCGCRRPFDDTKVGLPPGGGHAHICVNWLRRCAYFQENE